MKPKVCCRPNTTIKEVQFQTYPNLYPLNENRLPIVVWAVSADVADTAGNFGSSTNSVGGSNLTPN